ncbi:hypothetical protein VMCG_09840 [Cytospora schulzeri]|uniref:Carotenoid oxygenase n=1 Tax=Cytospora schulzeri TaxID=448051 RepID=A0A423VHP6_9PEZI|nr:hypothetical protein VMCG_09840 [Valsa malicola]
MSASDDLEPVINSTIKEAIQRTAGDEVDDLGIALKNAVSEAYLNWPNEAGFDHLDEHRGPIELNFQGTIPSWAAGSLFRTGPGLSKIEDTPKGTIQISHWFDGLAHTHRFDIVTDPENNRTKVLYSSRRQSDDFVNYVQQNGFHDMISFGQKSDPCAGLFSKLMTSWSAAKPNRETKKLENVAVTVQLGVPGLQSSSNPEGSHRAKKTVWLGTDAHYLRELDPQTLEPIGFAVQNALHPGLDGPLACAHAQRCPVTGDYFNINIDGGPKPEYKVFRVSATTGETVILANLSFHNLPMAYIHSFYLSEHFVILRVPSSHFSSHGLSMLWKKNLLEAMEPFDNSKRCRWFVVDRHHGRGLVTKFDTEAAFFFHTVNCFEEPVSQIRGPKVILTMDTVEYPTMDILEALKYDVLLNHRLAWLRIIPRRPMTEIPTPIVDKPINIPAPHVGELPTINPAYHTKPYRFVYSLAMGCRSTFVDTIVKTDLVTHEALQWNNPTGHTPGEAIFVGRPGASEEDDGVLLSVVLDGTCAKSYLLCLDAMTMKEMGRAEMDFAVGFGFHGVHTTEI